MGTVHIAFLGKLFFEKNRFSQKIVKKIIKKIVKKLQEHQNNGMSDVCQTTYPPCPILSNFAWTPQPPKKSDIIYVRSLTTFIFLSAWDNSPV